MWPFSECGPITGNVEPYVSDATQQGFPGRWGQQIEHFLLWIYVRIYVEICGYMWIYVDICGYMMIYVDIYIYISVCVISFKKTPWIDPK